jgi:hypothetical protein
MVPPQAQQPPATKSRSAADPDPESLPGSTAPLLHTAASKPPALGPTVAASTAWLAASSPPARLQSPAPSLAAAALQQGSKRRPPAARP